MFRRLLLVSGAGMLGMVVLALVSLRVAALFGAGTQLDAYLVGVAGPSLVLSLAGAVVTSFLTPRLSIRSPAEAARKAGEWATLGFVLAALVTGTAALGSHVIIAVLAPGLSARGAHVASTVLTVYSLSIPATLAATVYGAFGFANGRVWTSGLASALYAAFWLALLFARPFIHSGAGVAMAGVIASQLQLAVAFVASSGARGAPRPWPRWRLPARLLAALGSVVAVGATATIGKLNLVLDPLLGSLAGHGAVTKLSYATRLSVLMIVMCGQGPALALLGARRSAKDPRNPLGPAGVGASALISMGAAVAIAITFEPVARLSLAHGHFTSKTADAVGGLVRAYAPYVLLTSTGWSIESVLFSMGLTWRILLLNVPGLVANITISAALLPLIGLVARPIGAASGALLYLVLLARTVRRQPGGFRVATAIPWRAVLLLACAVGALCAAAMVGGNALVRAPALWSLGALIGTAGLTLGVTRSWLASIKVTPVAHSEPAYDALAELPPPTPTGLMQ